AFVVGIAAGSLLCSRLGGSRGGLGLVAFGALGLGLFGIDLALAAAAATAEPVVRSWELARILGDIVLLGASGGLYVIPLYVRLQREAAEDRRARMIAFNNLLNALFMVAASLLGMLVLGLLQRSIAEFFLLLSLLHG